MLKDQELRLAKQIKKEYSPYMRDASNEMAIMAVVICRACRVDTEGFLDMWRRVRTDMYFHFQANNETHPDGTS